MHHSVSKVSSQPFASFIAAILLIGVGSGCGGNFADHPRTYAWVFGTNAPAGVQVTRSAFWQSSHFTYEYSVFMQLTNASQWADTLRQSGQLVATNLPPDWRRPSLAGNVTPAWFMPKAPSHYEAWFHTNDFKRDLLLARDPETGLVFYCDQQL